MREGGGLPKCQTNRTDGLITMSKRQRHPNQVSPYGPARPRLAEKPVHSEWVFRQGTLQDDLRRLEMVQEVRPMLPPHRRRK